MPNMLSAFPEYTLELQNEFNPTLGKLFAHD
jgi:hypothetical protein